MDDEALDAESRIVLLDNGSLSADSALEARALAQALSDRLGESVDAVSVAHSDRIPAQELGGKEAWVWDSYLNWASRREIDKITVLPLFFGPAFALKKAKSIGDRKDGLRIDWADCLVSQSDQDELLIAFFASEIIHALDTNLGQRVRALLVDHGSPFPTVTDCRNYIGEQIGNRMGPRVESVVACSMERREGEAYDFNEPTLSNALREAKADGIDQVILCPMFLFPGRHAGLGGDIAGICEAEGWGSQEWLARTNLVGASSTLLELLELRLKSIGDKAEIR